ncbi:MAG: DNA-formamidopyrimidine glycosylase family protein [Microthrixaceae bacterium]
MPELPEVETIRAQLEPILSGATIADAWTFGTQKFAQATEVVGMSIIDVRRRGKYLIIGLSSCGATVTPEHGLGIHWTPS